MDLNVEVYLVIFGLVIVWQGQLFDVNFGSWSFVVVVIFFCQFIGSIGDWYIIGFFVLYVLDFWRGQVFKEGCYVFVFFVWFVGY